MFDRSGHWWKVFSPTKITNLPTNAPNQPACGVRGHSIEIVQVLREQTHPGYPDRGQGRERHLMHLENCNTTHSRLWNARHGIKRIQVTQTGVREENGTLMHL
eukprot:1020126-Amphidinium_carterae.1